MIYGEGWDMKGCLCFAMEIGILGHTDVECERNEGNEEGHGTVIQYGNWLTARH